MMHIAFLFYLITLILGFSSIGICLVFYVQHKKKVILLFALFILSLALILIELSLNLYQINAHLTHIIHLKWISYAIDLLGATLFIVATPLFFHYLLGLSVSPLKRVIIFSFIPLCIFLSLLNRLFDLSFLTYLAFLPLLFGSMGYSLLLVIINWKRIASSLLKNAMKLFVIVTVLFAPLIFIEIIRSDIPFLRDIVIFELFSLPAYFFSVNMLSIVFAVRYLNQPPYYMKGELTKYFISNYQITDRETDIIALLLQGQSYNQISDKLYISYKTVDKHIQNIYQKAEVNNRVQLLNLIMANKE